MQTKAYVWAAAVAALLGLSSSASAQYGAGSFGPGAPYGVQTFGPPQSSLAASYQQAGEAPPAPLSGGAPSCTSSCGTGGCGTCGCDDCCCCEGWCHKVNFFADFLYLRPRNCEVAYAVPIDGPLLPVQVNPVQVGPVAMVDADADIGIRGGVGFTLNECTAIVLSYTHFDTEMADQVILPGGLPGVPVLRPLVMHPFPNNAIGDVLDATAIQNIEFELIDLDYKGLFAYNCDYKVNYVIGARYGKLDQKFQAEFLSLGVQQMFSTVQFEGAGLKLGLEGEYYGVNSQFFGYGKGFASLLGGDTRATYFSRDNQDPNLANTSWEAGRLVYNYDLEVGVGWRNQCDTVRLSVGYMYSIWTNVVKTNEWINAVQANNFVDQSDNFNGMMTFDGLTARAEIRW